jgi:hypothetical protein
MAVEAAEIRISELDDAVAFAKALGSEFAAAQVITSRSLIARDGDKIVGTVLCVKDAAGGVVLEVALAKDGDAAGLAQHLIDRVLPKIQMRGVRRCQIITRGGAADSRFWNDADWFTQIDVRCEVVAATHDHPGKAPEASSSENSTNYEPQQAADIAPTEDVEPPESADAAEPVEPTSEEGKPGDATIETAA